MSAMNNDDDIFFDATSGDGASKYSSNDGYDVSENTSAFGDFEDAYTGMETTTETVATNVQFSMNGPQLHQNSNTTILTTQTYDDPFAVLSTPNNIQPTQQLQESFPPMHASTGFPGHAATNTQIPAMDQSESSSGFGDFVEVAEEVKKDDDTNKNLNQNAIPYVSNNNDLFGAGTFAPSNGNLIHNVPPHVRNLSSNSTDVIINNNNQSDDPFSIIIPDNNNNNLQSSTGMHFGPVPSSASYPLSIQHTTNDPFTKLDNFASTSGGIIKSYSDTAVDPFEALTGGNHLPLKPLDAFTTTQNAIVSPPEVTTIPQYNIPVVSGGAGKFLNTSVTESGNVDLFLQHETTGEVSKEFSIQYNAGAAAIEDDSFGDFATHVENTTSSSVNANDPFMNVTGGGATGISNYIQNTGSDVTNTNNHFDIFRTGTTTLPNNGAAPPIAPSNSSMSYQIPLTTVPSIIPTTGSGVQCNNMGDPFSVITTENNTNLIPSGYTTTAVSIQSTSSIASAQDTVQNAPLTSVPLHNTPQNDPFTIVPMDNNTVNSAGGMTTNASTEDDPFAALSGEHEVPLPAIDTFGINHNVTNVIENKISVDRDDDNSGFGEFVEPNQTTNHFVEQTSSPVDVTGGECNTNVGLIKESSFANTSSLGASVANNIVYEIEDDDFGDFDNAPNVKLHYQQPPIEFYPTANHVADDDFDDFKAPVPQFETLQPNDARVEVDKNNNFSDGFGDFDAAPTIQVVSTIQDIVTKENGNNGEVAQDDADFGDFAATVPQQDQNQLIASEIASDDFGDFDDAPTTVTTNEWGALQEVAGEGKTDYSSNIKNTGLYINNSDQIGFFGSGIAVPTNGGFIHPVQPTNMLSANPLDDPFSEIARADNNFKMSFGSSFDSTHVQSNETSIQNSTNDPIANVPLGTFALDSGAIVKTNSSTEDPFAAISVAHQPPETNADPFAIIQQVDNTTPEYEQSNIHQTNETVVSDNGNGFFGTPKRGLIDDNSDMFVQNESVKPLSNGEPQTNTIDEDESFGDFETTVINASEKIQDAFTDFAVDANESSATATLPIQPLRSSSLLQDLTTDITGDKTLEYNKVEHHNDEFSEFGEFVDPNNVSNDFAEPEVHGIPDHDLQKVTLVVNKSLSEANYKGKDIDEDDFGDFDHAQNVPNIDETDVLKLRNQQSPIEPFPIATGESDSDFGDFVAPVSDSFTGIQHSLVEGSKKVDLADVFGDFDAGPTIKESVSIRQPQDATKGNGSNEADDNFGGFGDFDAASAPVQQEQELKAPTVALDNFGGFDNAPTIAEKNEVNDFGDFAVISSESVKEHHQSNNDDTVSNNFGDFDVALPVAGPNLTKSIGNSQPHETTKEINHNVAAVDNDDFGDFGDFVAPSAQVQEEQLVSAPSVAMDDFGDFDNAPSVAENNKVEDFGDFVATSSQTQEDKPQLHTPDSTIDNFGGFDNAQTVDGTRKPEKEISSDVLDRVLSIGDAVPSVQIQLETEINTSFGDDFGDFDTAPVVQERTITESEQNTAEPRNDNEEITDDDDFGDFGDFDAAPQQEQQETGVAVDNDFDDDFGDFDTAQTNPESSSPPQQLRPQENFGNFSSFPVVTPAPKPVVNDPFIQHLRSITATLFPDQLENEIDEEDDEPNVQSDVLSIKEILVSLEESYKKPETDNSYKSVLEVLNSTPSSIESTSKAIIHNGGEGPFGHVSFPIGGFKSFSSTT